MSDPTPPYSDPTPPYYQPPNQQNQPGYTYYPPNEQANQPVQPGGYPPSSSYSNQYNANNQYNAYQVPGMSQAEPGSGLAIAGLVVGIGSLVFCWIPFLGFLAAIIGIILSAMGRRAVSRRTIAIVGFVLSIIALVIGLIWSALFFAGIIAAINSASSSSTY